VQSERQNFISKLVSVFIFLIGVSQYIWATPFSQQLYEERNKIRCEIASASEISLLQCQLKSNRTYKDLDKLSEHLVFSELATRELDSLKCLNAETEVIKTNDDVRSSALKYTCSRIDSLRRMLKSADFLEKEIKSYEKINDGAIRIVPAEESKSNDLLLNELRAKLTLTQENIRLLRENDLLLGLPSVFEFVSEEVNEPFYRNKKDEKNICTELTKKLPQLLAKDAQDMKQSQMFIEKRMKNDYWIDDTSFKRQLWGSSGRTDLISQLKKTADLSKSTFCRLEGRYGQGAVGADKLKLIASLGVGFEIAAVGRLVGLLFIKRMETAYKVARVAAAVEILAGTAYTAHDISEACREKLNAMSEKKSCEAIGETQMKTLFFKEQEAKDCLIASASGAIFAGMSAIGIRGLVKKPNPVSGDKLTDFHNAHLLKSNSNLSPDASVIRKTREQLRSNNIGFSTTGDAFVVTATSAADPNHPFVRLLNQVSDMGYKVQLLFPENTLLEGSRGAISAKTKTLYLPADTLQKMNDPKNIEAIYHETRHIIETVNGTDASKMRLRVIEPTFVDLHVRYGINGTLYRLDEPIATYAGNAISRTSTQSGQTMVVQLKEILKSPPEFQKNFKYNAKAGTGELEIIPGKGGPYFEGRYVLEIDVGIGLEAAKANELGQKILQRYTEQLLRLDKAYKRIATGD